MEMFFFEREPAQYGSNSKTGCVNACVCSFLCVCVFSEKWPCC